MEKILLPETKGYKANLHCHTTDSDGNLSPEEIKAYYMVHGYSVVAYTDHGYMRDRSMLCDEKFIALNGYENSLYNDEPDYENKVYHFNFYANSPKKVGMVGISRFFYNQWLGSKSQAEKDMAGIAGGYASEKYSPENANGIIARAKEEGYLVTYNHPVWSRQSGEDWQKLKGLNAMEIFNCSCYVGGYEEDNGYIYDDMLRHGQKIFCVAADDNHNRANSPSDSFGGYTVMFPEKFTYGGVYDSLKNGDFYSSTGATIRGLHFYDGRLYVGTENAAYIRLTTNGRYCRFETAKDRPLTQCVFDIPEKIKYFRVTIKDIRGKKAYSNAYFTEDLRK